MSNVARAMLGARLLLSSLAASTADSAPAGRLMPARAAVTDRIVLWYPFLFDIGYFWFGDFYFWFFLPHQEAVLVDGLPTGATCQRDKALAVTGYWITVVDVGPFDPETSACPAEIAVFSNNAAMNLRSNPVWTTGSDYQVFGYSAPIEVPLNIWAYTGAATSAEASDYLVDVADEADLALSIYRDNKTGLTFTGTRPKRTSVYLGTGCGSFTSFSSATEAGVPLYRRGALNIYFIATKVTYYPDGYDAEGQHCAIAGYPDVIFITLQEFHSSTLAHEVGHALSLMHTGVNNTPAFGTAFTNANIMHNLLNTTTPIPIRDHLTLGQAYRINVHSESWVNDPRNGAIPVRDGLPVKYCQGPYVNLAAGACPAQDQEWP